jgi:SAM-dependent methyltransferase
MTDAHAQDQSTPAGIYDSLLGGTANTVADRAAAAQLRERMPEVVDAAWANRGFLQRVVSYLGRAGVHQFLDIGAGLPTQRNTHEVLAELTPEGRVVYVDIDPTVIERGRQMLADVPGATVIQADLRDADAILNHPETRRLLDFEQPIGLLLLSVMQFVHDDEDPWGLVHRYLDALAPGSYLALSVGTGDRQAGRIVEQVRRVYDTSTDRPQPRTQEQAERFFEGLEIVPPYPGAEAGLTYIGLWGAEDPQAADDDGSRWFYVAVGRKP